jgi:hypothetical protein
MEVAGLGRATVQRYVAAFRDGGLDGLRAWGVTGPVSALVAHERLLAPGRVKVPGAIGRTAAEHKTNR